MNNEKVGELDRNQEPGIRIKEQRPQESGNGLTNTLLVGFVLLLLIVSFVNIFLLFNIQNTLNSEKAIFNGIADSSIKLNERIETALKESAPAKINIISIVDTSCGDCFNVNPIVEQIKRSAINVVSENKLDINSPEASELIKRYGISKIPAVIVSGEIGKAIDLKSSWSELGTTESDALVLRNIVPPYRDLKQNRIVGRISMISLVDSSCRECFNISLINSQLLKAGLIISKEVVVDISSEEGKDIIERYNITMVPTIILSSDADAYSNLRQIWSSVGSIESDGSYVLRVAYPPYRDIITKKIKGLVELTNIVDNSCSDCYNVSLHKSILANMGIFVSNESTFDVSSTKGKSLIKKYNITKVPAVILSNDADAYSNLKIVWEEVGSIESDGSYVFRNIEAVKGWIYRNITSS